jgi:hypothetical protein
VGKTSLGSRCENRARACLSALPSELRRTLEKKKSVFSSKFQAFFLGRRHDRWTLSLPNLISSEFLSWKTNQQNKIRISQEVNTSLDIYILYVSGEHVRVWEPDGSVSGGFPNSYSLRLDWFPLTGQSDKRLNGSLTLNRLDGFPNPGEP